MTTNLAGAIRGYGRTENGAASNATSGSGLLDLFNHGAALRARQDFDRIVPLFKAAFKENPEYALACLFYLRDVRGGQGERQIFRLALSWLSDNDRRTFEKILPLVPMYGRWDDLFEIAYAGGMASDAVVNLVAEQLSLDMAADHPTLLAKWMPSENSGSKKKNRQVAIRTAVESYIGVMNVTKYVDVSPRQQNRKFAHFWMAALNLDPKAYRQMLTELRKRIRIVETLMSEQRWGDINYSAVPGAAMKLYRKAFGKHDQERFGEFIEAAKRGEVKINAGTLTPYDIMQRVGYHEDPALDALWNNLPDFLGDKDILPLIDLSGSMNTPDGVPMTMAMAMGLYLAKHNKGQFRGSVITFSADPKFVEVDTTRPIHEQLRTIRGKSYGYNTNLNKVFKMLLAQAKRFNVPQDKMPKYICIVSDMQFDEASGAVKPEVWGGGNFTPDPTNFEAIEQLYAAVGYEMPQVIFWNVRSAGTDAAVTKDKKGVILVSGQNPVAFEKAIKVDFTPPPTPFEAMMAVLDNERYMPILEVLRG